MKRFLGKTKRATVNNSKSQEESDSVYLGWGDCKALILQNHLLNSASAINDKRLELGNRKGDVFHQENSKGAPEGTFLMSKVSIKSDFLAFLIKIRPF